MFAPLLNIPKNKDDNAKNIRIIGNLSQQQD